MESPAFLPRFGLEGRVDSSGKDVPGSLCLDLGSFLGVGGCRLLDLGSSLGHS